MERLRKRFCRRGFMRKVKDDLPLILIAIVVISVIVIIIALLVSMDDEDGKPTGFAESDRIECPGFSKENCTNHFCLYNRVKLGPSCYMAKNSFSFHVKNVTDEDDGISIQLTNITEHTPYGKSFENVIFRATYLTENILRFQFKDADKARYEVPVQKHFPLLKDRPSVDLNDLAYEIIHTNETEVFNFQVKRKDNGSTIWDTNVGGLVMSGHYLQIASYLPSENVYGIGEHADNSLKHDLNFVSWPMFSRDRAAKGPGNLYGVHPFYTCLEKDDKSHGVLFLNSNAMEVTLMPAPAVTFRTTGGILDFFIFVGDTPEHVVQLYTLLIGRPVMPPYWGLGFQLSRFGYESLHEVKTVIDKNRKAKIPIAVHYLDIDHMSGNKTFTYDPVLFQGLPEYIEKQKEEHGLKWVIILDPAIPAAKNYIPYSSGIEKSIFIRRNPSWKPEMFPKNLDEKFVYGKVWPKNYVAFPDYFLNSTQEWWKTQVREHRKILSFDALWIDMNEPSNFGTNEKDPGYCNNNADDEEDCWSLICPQSDYDDPIYNPLSRTGTHRLSEKTLCMDSIQGDSDSSFLHYDVHSLYGWSQTLATSNAVREATNTRSFVVTRSTYPSSGRYSGHWLGDNHSTFEDLARSIIGMLEFNLFGIPYVGADVCGFFGSASPELCKRWMQLGAFYPYFRNHNAKNEMDQDPAAMGAEVLDVSRKAIERRLSLNPFLYTLLYKAHVHGNTVVRPVFHEFPSEAVTWTMDRQFMWGHSLLISPILQSHPKSVSVYLPKDKWWHFLEEQSTLETRTEQYVIVSGVDDLTPIHVRGGSIIPFEKYYPGFNAHNATSRNITLYIFPKEGKALGDLFVDDGDSIDTIENDAYALYNFTFTNCSVDFSSDEKEDFKGPTMYVNKIVIFTVTNIVSVSDNTTFTTDKEYENTVIDFYDKMSSVKQIKWETDDGSCSKSD